MKNTSPPYQDTNNGQSREKVCGRSVMQILWKPCIISPLINKPI